MGAALLTVYIPLDLVVHHTWAGALVRVGWIACLLVAAALQLPGRARLADGAGIVVAAVSGLGAVFTVASVGGGSSPRLGSLLALPLVVLAIAPEVPAAAGITAAITVSGGAWLVSSTDGGAGRVVEWAVVSGAVGLISVHAAVVFGKIWKAGLEGERRRASMAEALAASERLEGERLRLQGIGRLAARVAHEMNNPLAAAQANARWLADHPGGGEEARSAAEDLLASVERIAVAVAALGGFVGELQEARVTSPPDDARPATARTRGA